MEKFSEKFLCANDFYHKSCSDSISFHEYKIKRYEFVKSWVLKYLNNKPDSEQIEAIGSVEMHTQVIARAGSGKTSTLVNRAMFLQKHCHVAPSEMLILAFNKKAANEIKARLTNQLSDNIPHVMTFHALAYALIHPEETLIYDDEKTKSYQQSRSIQDKVIDEYLKQPKIYDKIRILMTAYFQADWHRIIFSGYDMIQQKMLQYRRSLTSETLDGKYVKSFGEKTIANFLCEHGIDYKYERNFWWDGINYRPDFTIGDDKGIVIEYFGLAGDPDYDEMSAKKRKYWEGKSPVWQFLEFDQYDLGKYGPEGFCDLLKQRLESCDLDCNRLTEEEIWTKIKSRAIDTFTKSMKVFIGRCRKQILSINGLAQLINNHRSDSVVEKQFLELANIFYGEYLEQLKASNEEDFDGLMQRSIPHVESGNTQFLRKSGNGDLRKLRYIMIDEYQDFSELFYRLIHAIQIQNPQAQFFCVGDDWQSINGFVGSDLQFYQNFDEYFKPATTKLLSTNYRSATSIVNLGNTLMQNLGSPARPHKRNEGFIRLVDTSSFFPTPQESEKYLQDKITPAVLRLIHKITQNKDHLADSEEKSGIVLLSRKNHIILDKKITLDDFLKKIHSSLPKDIREHVSISTAHKYKGLEKNVVIVLDAVESCYPLIHPNAIFTRVLGDTLELTVAEERRLFYVALTRAIDHLFIITTKDHESPFLKDLQKQGSIEPITWSNYPPPITKSGKITVKICGSNTFYIKEKLKDDNFKWDDHHKAWCRNYPHENFSHETFFNEAKWIEEAIEIYVHICDEQDSCIETYYVDRGQWQSNSPSLADPDFDDIPF